MSTLLPESGIATAPAEAARSGNNSTLDDTYLCQWEKCSERCTSAETLFDHICEKHVGRKSTNNLNLTCAWNSCRTSTVKRDHITSHIRVHVPLKPHKCDFCGKAFKRPQDLKKHVKTHADDSVLMRSPDQNGYGGRKATGNGYYDPSAHMHSSQASHYGSSHHTTHNGYYAPQQQPSSYGPVYYPLQGDAGHMNQHAAYDSRKRHSEAANDFVAAAKRRQFDPSSYEQVSHHLTGLTGFSDYVSAGPAMMSVEGHGGNGHMPYHQYALPIPNLRTKDDLKSMDNFLDRVQATVYENSNAAAAAGIHQPGAHYTTHSNNFRQSHSPPQTLLQGLQGLQGMHGLQGMQGMHGMGHMNSHVSSSHVTAPMMATHSSQSHSSSTPALTPPSSSVSYTSGLSPASSHDMSPTSRHSSAVGAVYPSLPAVTHGYSHSTAAPTSTLGTNFDSDPRRRYSGGILQRSAPTDASDESRTPSPTIRKAEEIKTIDSVLPGATSPTARSESGESADSAADRYNEEWIENIRTVEALRKIIKERLERGEYVEDGEDVAMSGTEEKLKGAEKSSEGLYPTLPVIED